MKKRKKNRIIYILLLVILLPLILVELIIKGLFKLIKLIFTRKKEFSDQEFYDSLKSIEKVDIMSGEEFEQFLKRIFIFKGYSVSDTPRSGDYGADLLIKKDGRLTVVQAKRYTGNVGAKALQEIYSARAHYSADNMMVVTTANFTKQAQAMAAEQEIDLVDRAELIALMQEVQEIIKEDYKLSDRAFLSAGEDSMSDNFKYRI